MRRREQLDDLALDPTFLFDRNVRVDIEHDHADAIRAVERELRRRHRDVDLTRARLVVTVVDAHDLERHAADVDPLAHRGVDAAIARIGVRVVTEQRVADRLADHTGLALVRNVVLVDEPPLHHVDRVEEVGRGVDRVDAEQVRLRPARGLHLTTAEPAAVDEVLHAEVVDVWVLACRVEVAVVERDPPVDVVAAERDRGLRSVDVDGVCRVLAEALADAVIESLSEYEQDDEDEDSPGDADTGQYRAQLVAPDRVELLAPAIDLEHRDRDETGDLERQRDPAAAKRRGHADDIETAPQVEQDSTDKQQKQREPDRGAAEDESERGGHGEHEEQDREHRPQRLRGSNDQDKRGEVQRELLHGRTAAVPSLPIGSGSELAILPSWIRIVRGVFAATSASWVTIS